MEDISTHVLMLFTSYITNTISDEEINELKQWINQNEQNKQLFSKYLYLYKKSRQIGLLQTIDKEKAWNQLVSKLDTPLEKINDKNQGQVISFFKPWYKYIAAAVLIGILTTTYFFRSHLFDSSETQNPVIVNTNTITPGTDKATLTLEDGSNIALEEGKPFKNKTVSSSGGKLVYNSKKSKAEEIVYHYLTIPRGGEYFIKLSDGTQVWLNSESQLKFPAAFIEGETRIVELVYGEAYFDVSPSTDHKGAKFKVLNKSQEVEVLGTEFNIKAYKDEVNVYTTLVEGKVNVQIGSKKQSLMPNQQLNLNLSTNTSIINTIDVYNEISWKEGVFSFEEKTLKEMMKVLSRWYDIEVIFLTKSIEDKELVGILRKNQNIEDILNGIKNFGIIKNFKIENKKVILE